MKIEDAFELNEFDWRLNITPTPSLKYFLELPRRSQEVIMEYLSHWQGNLKKIEWNLWTAREAESPIESIFYITFAIYAQMKKDNICFQLLPQHEIEANGRRYRADFAFVGDDLGICYCNFKKRPKNLVIECDGYEFHEKTKEQVAYDNQREYDLKMAGFDVLRFSGSEIYNRPYECAEKAFNYLYKQTQKKTRKGK